jgi:pimeloyl-ACP methyl ester carboxylesterase
VRERAVRFGKSTSLIGVITEPSQGTPRAGLGVVFLNSGILHHVGACRLHVRLARQLAERGFTSIRFDLSGIGDSEARKDSLTFEQSAQLEVQEAMDYLTATKRVHEFVLIGLCSGADMGFLVSQADARVVGLVQLDAYAYRDFGYYFHHYAPRMLRLGVWTNFVKRKLGMKAPNANGGKGPEPGSDYVRPEYRRKFPPKEVVEAGLRKLAARGVDLLFLFSGGQPDHYNYRGQHQSTFRSIDFGGRIQVEYYRTADHLFSALEHQRAVDAAIVGWAAQVEQRRANDSSRSVIPIEAVATRKLAQPVAAVR